MEDTRKPPLSVDADEIESVSRRYCFRGNWGNRKRRSTRLPKPVKTKASGSQKNPKRKRESNDNSNNTKERKHDNHVAPIQMIERKSVTVKKGANLTTAEGGLNNMEKSKCKVVSTASKIVGRKALDDVSNVQGKSSRKVVHDGPKLMKSSPELKRVNQAATSIPKENAGNSDKGKVGKAGKEVAPQVNNGRNHLWKNQVSDGFMIKDQTNIEAHALPRKSIRPIVNTALQNTQAQRTSKSKNISDLNKQKSVAAISSKNKEDAVASSHPENIAIVVPHEAAQGQLSFDADGNPRTVSDIISGRNLDGRRSYTSSLMSLEKCGEVVKLETLPCIDDNRNQIEDTEYVDESYQYYWDKEKKASMADTDENIVSEILLQLPVLFAESESRRYCVRVKWGNRKRRSTRLPKPVETKASGSQKNPKRKRKSGDEKDDSDKTKAINLCLEQRKHDNHVAQFRIQMIDRKSVTANNGANLTTAQGGLNNMEKSKGKVVSTASKRKALADVSNVHGNSPSNAVLDGAKLISQQEPDIRKLKNCIEEGIMTEIPGGSRPGHVRVMGRLSSSQLLDATHDQVNNHEECKRKQLETDEKMKKQEQMDMIIALLMLENLSI